MREIDDLINTAAAAAHCGACCEPVGKVAIVPDRQDDGVRLAKLQSPASAR